MTEEKLIKANELDQQIREYQELMKGTNKVLNYLQRCKSYVGYDRRWTLWCSDYIPALVIGDGIKDDAVKALKKLCKLQIKYYEELISKLQDEFKKI